MTEAARKEDTDICACGDYRWQHKNREGACQLCSWAPMNPFNPCQKFRWADAAKRLEEQRAPKRGA